MRALRLWQHGHRGEGSVRYYGIVTHEGDQTLVEFPDAPGCQTFAELGEGIHELAQEALDRCIGTHLAHGEAPPQPSGKRPRAPKAGEVIEVIISPWQTSHLIITELFVQTVYHC